MKLLSRVPAIEVKRCFIIADLAASKHPRNKSNTGGRHIKSISLQVFETKLQSVIRKILKLKEEALDKIIAADYPPRIDAYNNSEWYRGEVETTEIGVWRRAGGMPLSWTNGSLKDTARKVMFVLKKDPKRLPKGEKYNIPNILLTNVNEIQKERYLLPIVLKGGTGTRGRRWLRKKMRGDIDDGCTRSIALALNGAKTIKAYIGLPKKLGHKKG